MKGKNYSEEGKIRILRQADGLELIADVCRERNISEGSFPLEDRFNAFPRALLQANRGHHSFGAKAVRIALGVAGVDFGGRR